MKPKTDYQIKKIAITGANGQLGQCFKLHSIPYQNLSFTFLDRKTIDITHKNRLRAFFSENKFDYIINCAAYTAVEKAEDEPDLAFAINANGVQNLAETAQLTGAKLIHISTDYVFDGSKQTPYQETDGPNPLNVYGKSKLMGEQNIQNTLTDYLIIRTSWLYSQYGHNFYRTMKRLMAKGGKALQVTTEQTGTPTNANDLAQSILKLIDGDSGYSGLYHYTNAGFGTWFDFADQIWHNLADKNTIAPEKVDHFKTKAKRPKNSVLDSQKIKDEWGISLIDWKKSLRNLQKTQ